MSLEQDTEYQIEKTSIRYFIYVTAISSAINVARWIGINETSTLLWSISLLSSVISIYFLREKHKGSRFQNSFIYWLNYLAVTYIIGQANYVLANSDIGFVPFGGFKIEAIAIALIAPYPLLNGYLSILGCALVPVVMYYSVFVDLQTRMTVQEPWLTVVSVVICFLVYMFRHRGLKVERELSKLKTEKENLEELAKIFLSLRDLTNTPVQNLMLVSTLLLENKINAERASKYLNVSTQQLSLISEILSEFRLADRSLEEFRSIYTQSDPLMFLRGRIGDLQKKVNSSFKE
jgi:hypothetical protein